MEGRAAARSSRGWSSQGAGPRRPRRPPRPVTDVAGIPDDEPGTVAPRRRRAVNEPGSVETRRLLRPEMIAAIAVGIAVGGVAGAIIRGSGSVYDTWFLAGCLFVLLALAGLGALAAAHAHRTSAARILAGFAGVALVTAGVAYAIAPPYRSPNADLQYPGSATVHVAEPAAIEWDGKATCRTGPHDPTVFMVWMPDVKVGDQWIAVLLNLSRGVTSVQAEKLTIAMVASADYVASPGSGLDATQVGINGLTGSVRFSAVPVPVPSRSPEPEPYRLTGTFEWACESTPSG
jgi:hypothetical protein